MNFEDMEKKPANKKIEANIAKEAVKVTNVRGFNGWNNERRGESC